MNDGGTPSTSRTDWERLATMQDDEIDYSDIPPLTDEFFAQAQLTLPNAVPLDPDILDWFKAQGRDYTTQINRVLREYMALHQRVA